ncbi:MAG: putative Fe-S cluster assembly protein SufT [Gammaproteobacteria bacterium]|nr:putative Fe-S cluster assembly protein SufT [Gammaproteobacteria bacterium]NNF62345.1 putative Fe-S cluster assembly protein SufT [Gammaproteobacteria bacterium]NNM21344.1 putative Fe-S cluster assembly protein SufT [Gammaproteobacteria bacterium]
MFHPGSEPVSLRRDVDAVIIPAGDHVQLHEGTDGYITQALGGSFTVYIDGNLFRIAGHDADALGKERVMPPEAPENATDADIEKIVADQLRTCYDPEIPINIVDLGLIYRCDIDKNADGKRQIEVDMTLTAPGCGMGEILVHDVRTKLLLIPTVSEVKVDLVFDPPWNHTMMSEEARLQTGMMY